MALPWQSTSTKNDAMAFLGSGDGVDVAGSEKQRDPTCQLAGFHRGARKLRKQRNGFAFFQQVDAAPFSVVDQQFIASNAESVIDGGCDILWLDGFCDRVARHFVRSAVDLATADTAPGEQCKHAVDPVITPWLILRAANPRVCPLG